MTTEKQSFILFDILLDMGELAESIQKKMQPKYDAVYGKGVIDFSVTRNDLHSISFTWKRNLKLPKKELIGIMDAELITGWKVSNTKPLEFVDSRPTQAKAGKVLLRSFAPRYKKLMRKHYKLDYNNYDISVSATSTELKMTIKFIPFRGVVYMYTYNGKEKEHGKSYVGETVNEKARRRNWKKLDDKYANEKLSEAKRRLGTKDWIYHELEIITDHYDLGMLKPKLFSLEGDYIEKYDTINNGYNVAKYGTGNKGVNFSASHRQKIRVASKGRTHTAATKQKISAANLGRTQSDATKQRISQGNTGKKRTPEMRKAQSERMKGIEPKAASEGAKKWRETHGGGYWGSHKIPDTARANMKLAQQKRGKAVRAFAPDGTWQDFNTMNDAAKALGMGVGSIANNLKSKGVCNNGYRFKTTVPNFPRP